MKSKKIILYTLLFFLIIFSISGQAGAEKTNYYIDISLFPEGYANFKIDVDNYGNLGGIVIELPSLKCEDNLDNISDLRKKIIVSDLPDEQTLEGLIDLKPKCMGIGITKPSDNSKDFTVLFTYKNYDWEIHPESYPFDDYKMPILISFPEVRTEDSVLISTRIFLPPNTEVENISAYTSGEHPANTKSDLIHIINTTEKRGNQQIILLESHSYLTKNNPAQAIFIPLEYKRGGFLPKFFKIFTSLLFFILILFTFLMHKKENTDLGILTIVALVFSYYQFFVSDKPQGVITRLDWMFLIFIGWSLLLFIYHILNKLGGLQTIITELSKIPNRFNETINKLIKILK